MYDVDFDSQRLMFHPKAVGDWLEHGTTRGPLYTEMELTARCNCRCVFCGVDHLVNKTADTLPPAVARQVIDDLQRMGNKSIMFAGHGEPLLHADAEEIIAFAAARMSASVTTNGIPLDESRMALIDGLKWLRLSVNGHDAATYAAVHRTHPDMFARVLRNLEGAVRRKRDRGLRVTIGVQVVLVEQNRAGIPALARQAKAIGADYFSVKPYSQHPLATNRLVVENGSMEDLERELKALDGGGFRTVFRAQSFGKVGQAKPYRTCHGTHFLSFISANGDVWECNVFAGDPRFWIGNACRESLADIWAGPRRQAVRKYIEEDMDLAQCRDICRMEACNAYLWRLKNPLDHDDFI